MTFTIAIIGRPNVGKSTLFNRLTGTRHALVDDVPGVTRDVREGEANLGPLSFRVLDTAGLDEVRDGSLSARMTELSLRALKEADAALMLVDARAGITPVDRHFADVVRKSGKPAVLVVNKAEGKAGAEAMAESYALGLGDPLPISAEHGEGMADLYEALLPMADRMEEVSEAEQKEEGPIRMAIVGRPNAGKSTLINQLIGRERVLTGPEAGITRDSIAVPFEYRGQSLVLVDTAGMRKRTNVRGKLEKLSVADTLRSIRYAQVVVLVMDATLALEKQDLQIADLVEQEGRCLVLAVNKWDLVPKGKREQYLEVAEARMEETLAQLSGVPVVPVCAEKGEGLDTLMKEAFRLYEIWNRRITTGELNRWLEDALQRHQPPLVNGRRLKIRYITQAKTRPPSFMVFTNLSDIPAHYLRYLIGGMRDTFGLRGVPLRVKIRKNKNPYETK